MANRIASLREEPSAAEIDRQEAVPLALIAERNRLAQALHDTLCQTLSGINLHAALLQRRLEAEHSSASGEAVELKKAIRQASKELQKLVGSLRKPSGD